MTTINTLTEIKEAVMRGVTVYYGNPSCPVVRKDGKWLIHTDGGDVDLMYTFSRAQGDFFTAETVTVPAGLDGLPVLSHTIQGGRAVPIKIRTYKHLRTGGTYRIVMTAICEADSVEMTVYQSLDTGEVWVRPTKEFYDGRFRLIP